MPPRLPPCVIHEDEHLLVVNKPAGWNTHAPSPYAGEGIYDWLRHREPRWAALSILHRLDKETSGVMVFGKTPLANRSLTEQFTRRDVRKKYRLLTDRKVTQREFTAKTNITRLGDRYASGHDGEPAETRFRFLECVDERTLIEAEPLTGRTHQIRVHAAENGFPILGDRLYGGTSVPRVCLHAAELAFKHPANGEALCFTVAADFESDTRRNLRAAVIDPAQADSWRIIHGASDGWPDWYVERFGEFVLSQSEQPLDERQRSLLGELCGEVEKATSYTPNASPVLRGAYHKMLTRQMRQTTAAVASPLFVLGQMAPEHFAVLENGVRFESSFTEGYSVGLFLDQRDNRRRFLVNHVAADFPLFANGAAGKEVLNTFAYTCGFSACAALAGARVTSLDLSRKYLDWGRRNFVLNGLDPAAHDFIYGDAFDWMRRLAKKGRGFDVIVLDPPTFSQSKESGVFRAEKDYGRLVDAALKLLRPTGVLLASTNAATVRAEDFVATVTEAIREAGRRVLQQHYVPQPPDFPISRENPAYLKTLWLRVS
ncbi:MAG: hypothetical protein EXS24_00275 [Pedosphaera sp.]|nr:hypothetical protein [Pedosphaera sp.]